MKTRNFASLKSSEVMKILHTADWHLGNTFHGHDRTAEHRHFLNFLTDTLRIRQPDALFVAGDVFDSSNPSAAAEELFYDFLKRATEEVPGLQVVVTAGNHDSAGRIEAPASLLKLHNIYVRGTLRHDEQGEPDFGHYVLPLSGRTDREAVCVCLALPYLRPADYPAGMSAAEGLRYWFDGLSRNLAHSDFSGLPVVACAHYYAAGASVEAEEHSERLVVGGQDCVPADVSGKSVAYTALGHIHRMQQVESGRNVWYAGSALPMSFSERHYRHGVLWTELDEESGEVSVERIAYEPLCRLLSIPSKGAATPSEVLDELSALPRREKNDDGSRWPYIEIKVEERQPEPSLMHDVAVLLEEKAVRFCRMVRVIPGAETARTDTESPDTLRRLSPMEMAHRVFDARYHSPMPPELEERFSIAVGALAAEETERGE